MQFPIPVDNDEPLARFALERGKFRSSDNTARHNLFVPAKDNVLSVFRTLELSEAQTFSLGDQYVGIPQNRPVLAYATLRALDFLVENLGVTPTAEPHPRHVDVEGWSDHASNLHKAQILATKSQLVLCLP